MNQLKTSEILDIAKKITELANEELWSEEELSQAIKILHSHYESIQFL